MASRKRAKVLAEASALSITQGTTDEIRERMRAYAAQHGRKLGSVALLSTDRALGEVKQVIPTGIDVLDHFVLGIGGWPAGRIVEFFGPESVGKSTLALLALGQCQRHGGTSILVDSENAFSRDWAQRQSVDVEQLLVGQPASAEESFEMLEVFLRVLDPAKGPHLAVWDSLAAATPAAELRGAMGELHVGLRARIANQGFRKIGYLAAETNTCIIVINQVRFKIGVMFGSPETTPGGQALRHHASVRMRFGAGAKVDIKSKTARSDAEAVVKASKSVKRKATEAAGKDVPVRLAKSRFTPEGRETTLRLLFDGGWQNAWSTVEHAKMTGALPKNAAATERSRDKAIEALGWGAEDAGEDGMGAVDE